MDCSKRIELEWRSHSLPYVDGFIRSGSELNGQHVTQTYGNFLLTIFTGRRSTPSLTHPIRSAPENERRTHWYLHCPPTLAVLYLAWRLSFWIQPRRQDRDAPDHDGAGTQATQPQSRGRAVTVWKVERSYLLNTTHDRVAF